jgi:PAS domain S-box-containing protein
LSSSVVKPISGPSGQDEFALPAGRSVWRAAGPILATGAAYYVGAKVGLAFTLQPNPISMLWPPNAVLLAALLLMPLRWWPAALAAALAGHLASELQGGVPLAMVLCWFVSNCAQALIGALLMRRFALRPFLLSSMRSVWVFCWCAVFMAPFLSSFLDAEFVTLLHFGSASYWDLFGDRFISNVVATLLIVPVALATLPQHGARPRLPVDRLGEAAMLLAALLAVSFAVFDLYPAAHDMPAPALPAEALLYVPVPLLLWAALRFGPLGASVALAAFAFPVMWGAVHGLGPFADDSANGALPVQLFLVSVGVPLLFLAALVEERLTAERAVRESEQRFAAAFRANPDAIMITNSMGEILDVNDHWQTLFGYVRAQALGRSVLGLDIHSADFARSRFLGLMRPGTPLRDAQIELRNRGGEILTTRCSSEELRLDGENCVITIMRDMTHELKVENEVLQQSRQLVHLARVARLADMSGALAHELSQPLTAILSNAQAAQRFLMHDPINLGEIRSILDDIVQADKRAGEVIRGLRVLMKKGQEHFAPVSLNEMVDGVLVFSHSDLVARGVSVKTELASDIRRVRGDAVQVQQLLLNLVSNACEAMEANDRGDRSMVIRTEFRGGDMRLILTDSGPGFNADQLKHLFEPLYTTKEHGLGLGLSICRMIADAHGATIRAFNAPAGRGAVFHVVFPALPEVA